MQEQKASKGVSRVKRIGIRNIIWLSLFGVLMLAVAITWLWPYRTLPTASWRDANSTLPWENESLKVEDVKGHWANATGNERMMLRAAYYPVAEIELGDSQGSGMLYITFSDSRGRQAGDTINLTYENGSFHPRHEVNISAEGKKARVFVETGYEQDSEFELHLFDASSPLWRINLQYRPEGAYDVQPMGFVTIPAKRAQ